MEELLLINPRRRGRRRQSLRGRPRDAMGRLLPVRRRRSNPANPSPRRRQRRSNPIEELALFNPAPRKRKSAAAAPAPRRRYKRRLIGRGKRAARGFMGSTLMPAAMGAAGALGLDILMGFLPIPAVLTTAPAKYLVKGAGAVGLGIAAGYIVAPATAHQLTVGALTVVIHEALKNTLASAMPSLQLGMLGEFGYVSPGMIPSGMQAYLEPPTMGMYLEGANLAEMAEIY